jgi:excisionase family DNA binding protein
MATEKKVGSMNVEQAAEYLGIKSQWLYAEVKDGRGPAHYRIGNRYRFHAEDLDNYALTLRVEPGIDEF